MERHEKPLLAESGKCLGHLDFFRNWGGPDVKVACSTDSEQGRGDVSMRGLPHSIIQASDARPRRGIPDRLVIPLGVLLGELHRLTLAPLLAGAATIATVARDVKTHITTFLVFDLLFQWLGLVIIFLVAMAVSRSRKPLAARIGSLPCRWYWASACVLRPASMLPVATPCGMRSPFLSPASSLGRWRFGTLQADRLRSRTLGFDATKLATSNSVVVGRNPERSSGGRMSLNGMAQRVSLWALRFLTKFGRN